MRTCVLLSSRACRAHMHESCRSSGTRAACLWPWMKWYGRLLTSSHGSARSCELLVKFLHVSPALLCVEPCLTLLCWSIYAGLRLQWQAVAAQGVRVDWLQNPAPRTPQHGIYLALGRGDLRGPGAHQPWACRACRNYIIYCNNSNKGS